MSREEAIVFIGFLTGHIGGGFHPDHFLSDYVNRNGDMTMSDQEIEVMQPMLDEAHNILGDDIYGIGLQLLNKCILLK